MQDQQEFFLLLFVIFGGRFCHVVLLLFLNPPRNFEYRISQQKSPENPFIVESSRQFYRMSSFSILRFFLLATGDTRASDVISNNHNFLEKKY